MKRFLLAGLGLLANFAAPAAAADLPRQMPYSAPGYVTTYNWTGFYIGANGGWGSSRNSWDSVPPAFVGHEGAHDADGGTIGGQVGYRWQAGNWVFGLEAQGNWADFNGSNVSLIAAPGVNHTKIDAFGLFTGQVGYAANNVLFYVKGGAAVTNNRYEGQFAGIVIDRAEETRWGGSVGAGVEYAFAPNWSFGVEYNHLFMGTDNYNFRGVAFVGNSRNDDIKQDADIVTARINYRFGGPAVTRY